MIDPQEEKLVLGVDPQVAFDKVAQFQTPGEIAKFLQEQGIKGIPQNRISCVISQYMQEMTGTTAITGLFGGFLPGSGFNWMSTEAMRQFIILFDLGDFPELIKSEVCETGFGLFNSTSTGEDGERMSTGELYG